MKINKGALVFLSVLALIALATMVFPFSSGEELQGKFSIKNAPVSGILDEFAVAKNNATALDYIVTTTDDHLDNVCDSDCSLRDAIYEANNDNTGDHTIFLPAGTYERCLTSFTFDNPSVKITLYGHSSDDTILDFYDFSAVPGLYIESNSTVEIKNISILNSPHYAIYALSGADTLIHDSVLSDGYGGIMNEDGTMEISDVTIQGNSRTGFANCGEAIVKRSVFDSNETGITAMSPASNLMALVTLELTNSEITNNSEDGIISYKETSISNSTISGNGYSGIFYATDFLTINNTTISGNQESGITFVQGYIDISDSVIENNEFHSYNHDFSDINGGGGISGLGGEVTVSKSTIRNNTSYANGGGIYLSEGGRFNLIESDIDGNTATTSGGGIYIEGLPTVIEKEVLVDKSLIRNNSATLGSAIYVAQTAWLLVDNSTIYNNEILTSNSSNVAGAIQNEDGIVVVSFCSIVENPTGYGLYNNTGNFMVKASIITGHELNFSGKTISASCNANIYSSGYNISDSSNCISRSIDIYSKSIGLGVLTDNGGETDTIALTSSSPAIDIVPRADCTFAASFIGDSTVVSEDQRSYSRGMLEACDAGAFEYNLK